MRRRGLAWCGPGTTEPVAQRGQHADYRRDLEQKGKGREKGEGRR